MYIIIIYNNSVQISVNAIVLVVLHDIGVFFCTTGKFVK